jgi:uncharacterized protein (TIGR02996 family)
MTDRESLIAAVIADPDDDGVRLVFADWCEEHGDAPRAEFIRSQIRRLTLKYEDPERALLFAREKELVKAHGAEWLRHLPGWAQKEAKVEDAFNDTWGGFRRGFLQGVVGRSPDFFLSDVAPLMAIEPITHVYMSGWERLRTLAKSPEFMRLIGLRFGHYSLGDAGVFSLSRLPPMPRLRHLDLYKNEIGDRGIRLLAQWPGLATVEELELSFNDFQSKGVRALIASPYLGKLRELHVEDLLIADRTKERLLNRFGKAVIL